MKTFKAYLSLLFFVSLTALAAVEEDIGFPVAASIPPDIVRVLDKKTFSDKYAVSTHINPFYLHGDFNGDGKLDTAILVKQKSTGKLGIAIVHSSSNSISIFGAGRKFGNGGDSFTWMDAWYIFRKSAVGQGVGEGAPPELNGDAIMVIKTESSSALIYWTGKTYKWYHQGD